MHPRTFKTIIFLLIIGFFGALLITLVTGSGLKISEESKVFLEGATQIENEGLYAMEINGDIQTIVHFPPLYSFVLALISQFGLSILTAARILNIIFFFLNIFLAGYICYRITGGNISWSIFKAILVLLAWPVLEVHLWVGTEPMLIFFINMGLLMLAEFLNKPKTNYLLYALICIALVPLIKYSGIILIPIACFAIFLYAPLQNGKKISTSLIFGFFTLMPVVLWFFRNYWIAGNLTNRSFSFSFITFQQLGDFLETISSWLIYTSIEENYRIYLFLIFLLFWFILLFSNLRQKSIHLLYFRNKQNLYLLRVFTIFLFFYFGYLTLYISISEINVSIDNQLIMPCFIPMLAIIFHTFFLWQKFSENNRFYRITLSIITFIFLATNVWYWLNIFDLTKFLSVVDFNQ